MAGRIKATGSLDADGGVAFRKPQVGRRSGGGGGSGEEQRQQKIKRERPQEIHGILGEREGLIPSTTRSKKCLQRKPCLHDRTLDTSRHSIAMAPVFIPSLPPLRSPLEVSGVVLSEEGGAAVSDDDVDPELRGTGYSQAGVTGSGALASAAANSGGNHESGDSTDDDDVF